MKKINKLLSMFFALIIVIGTMPLQTFAKDIKIPGEKIKTYVITTKNNTPVYKTSKKNDKKKIGTIYAPDLITITKYSDNTGCLYVTYPTSKGNKSGWIKTEAVYDDSNVFLNWMDDFNKSGLYVANKKITTYKRYGKADTLGYILKNDLVRCYDSIFAPEIYNGYVQVIYPITGGYKMGWIKYSDLTNNCKKLK